MGLGVHVSGGPEGGTAHLSTLKPAAVGRLSATEIRRSLLPQLRSCVVSSDDPYVRLPEHIEFSLAEAGELLEVLDVAVVAARTETERTAARQAANMITEKLWPGFDDLLDGEGEAKARTDDHEAYGRGDPVA